MYKNIKPRAFISFDFDNDENMKELLIGQCRNEGTPFDMEDWSVKEAFNESTWERECFEKIKKCDLLIVMVGKNTANCSGVTKEIRMAKNANVPVYGIKIYSDRNDSCPMGIRTLHDWTWANIKRIVEQQR